MAESEARIVAALYIDPRGPYPAMARVDAWDEARDAKMYDGPHPVVAHPPCGPWGHLRHLNRFQDPTCGPRAVEQVRRFGGVLEHPNASKLWAHAGLPAPTDGVDAWGGFTVQVDQVAWGHVARKRTWLYVVGVRRAVVDAGIRTGGTPTHWISGSRNNSTGGGSIPAGFKVCSSQKRRRSPPAFAAWLVSLARASVRP
jgi:hypothetical protein